MYGTEVCCITPFHYDFVKIVHICFRQSWSQIGVISDTVFVICFDQLPICALAEDD